MNNSLAPLLTDLNMSVTFESTGSYDFIYAFIQNRDGVELARFQIERTVDFGNLLCKEQIGELKTLFYNNIWPDTGAMLRNKDIVNFIESNYPGNTALAKQERVLSYIRSKTKFDGDKISISISEYQFSPIWRNSYVKNGDEFIFYVDSLIESSFLSCRSKNNEGYLGVALTVSGLNKVILLEENANSKICFVAMSFDTEMFKIYNDAIRPAILETGFEPLLISEKKDIPSDSTINDAILAAIKKSKFTIADFTNHKHGVYFESGYALGRGQKVIYTCREDEIGKAHFDTRNYPHIVWKDAEDLKGQLIDKIEVFIKS